VLAVLITKSLDTFKPQLGVDVPLILIVPVTLEITVELLKRIPLSLVLAPLIDIFPDPELVKLSIPSNDIPLPAEVAPSNVIAPFVVCIFTV